MAGQTLWDQLLTGTCNAVADIREKLIEEPWYGRTLDGPQSGPAYLSPEHSTASGPDQSPASSDNTGDIHNPSQEQGIDR